MLLVYNAKYVRRKKDTLIALAHEVSMRDTDLLGSFVTLFEAGEKLL